MTIPLLLFNLIMIFLHCQDMISALPNNREIKKTKQNKLNNSNQFAHSAMSYLTSASDQMNFFTVFKLQDYLCVDHQLVLFGFHSHMTFNLFRWVGFISFQLQSNLTTDTFSLKAKVLSFVMTCKFLLLMCSMVHTEKTISEVAGDGDGDGMRNIKRSKEEQIFLE